MTSDIEEFSIELEDDDIEFPESEDEHENLKPISGRPPELELLPRSTMPYKSFDFKVVPLRLGSLWLNSVEGKDIPRASGIVPIPDINRIKEVSLCWTPEYILLTDSIDIFSIFEFGFPGLERCMAVYGRPDVCTISFLRLLKKQLGDIPMIAVIDSEPASLKLMSFLEQYKDERVPEELKSVELDIKWLGFRWFGGKSFFRNVPAVPMTFEEYDATLELMDDDFVKKSIKRKEEVQFILDLGVKTELIALESLGCDNCLEARWIDGYLHGMLLARDWI